MQVLLSGRMLLLPEMVWQDVTVTRRAVANQKTVMTGCCCTRRRITEANTNEDKDYFWVYAR